MAYFPEVSSTGITVNISPGWQSSASQIATSVEKRIARALSVLRIDRFANVMPVISDKRVSVTPRAFKISSR